VLLALSFLAEAQQPKKVYRIGILHSESDSNPNSEHNVATLRQRLRELGYFEGQNVHFEYRWAEGKRDRLAELAADLLRHNVDVLVTTGTPAVRVAKQATRSVPIVMAQVGDAVENGIVASLARPGGNITGVSFMNPEIQSKWLELVTEASPKIRRVAVLVHPDNLNRPAFKANKTGPRA
jgi:putative ABC transport system substrate-binding protein